MRRKYTPVDRGSGHWYVLDEHFRRYCAGPMTEAEARAHAADLERRAA